MQVDERLFELPAGPAKPAHNRAYWNVQNFRHVFVTHLFQVHQSYDFPMILGQAADSLTHPMDFIVPLMLGFRRVIVGEVRFININAVLSLAADIPPAVDQNSEQPGVQHGAISELVTVF
jgi:hypothetical protein